MMEPQITIMCPKCGLRIHLTLPLRLRPCPRCGHWFQEKVPNREVTPSAIEILIGWGIVVIALLVSWLMYTVL